MDITLINTIYPVSPLRKAIDICVTNTVYSSPSRARSISSAQRYKLRQGGKCVHCEAQDHWVIDCPLALCSTASADVADKRVTIAAVYNNNNSYSLTASDIKDL
jgi:hypothetical protein